MEPERRAVEVAGGQGLERFASLKMELEHAKGTLAAHKAVAEEKIGKPSAGSLSLIAALCSWRHWTRIRMEK